MNDLVTLVNDRDEVIGSLDKYEAHRHPAQLHRAVSVWLVNCKGEVLFQQRSAKKIVGALWWGNTICGNVRPDENYEQCAQRRLREELGIEGVDLQPVYTFQYDAYANEEYGEHEMDRVFVGSYDGEVRPNPDEVVDFQWVKVDGLDDLQAEVIVTPWTLIMLSDARLRKTLLQMC